MIDPVDYATFQGKCQYLAEVMGDSLLVRSVVTRTLQLAFLHGDLTSVEEGRKRYADSVEHLKAKAQEPNADHETLDLIISDFSKKIESLPEYTLHRNALYQYFCENVVEKLLYEIPKLPDMSSLQKLLPPD